MPMRKHLLIFCTTFFFTFHFSPAQITFQKTLGGFATDAANAVQQTGDGGYIVAGTTISYGAGTYDMYVIRTNANGDTLWTRTFGGSNEDLALDVRQTTDG